MTFGGDGDRFVGLRGPRTAAILQAACDLLQEVGYERLTMDAVATRARAGKASLYRRWAGKAELIADVVEQVKVGNQAPIRDRGSLRADLVEVATRVGTARSREEMCVMRGLAAALAGDASLAQVFRRTFLDRRAAGLQEILARAQVRGEIPPGRDLDLLAQIIPAMVLSHTLASAQPISRDWLVRLIDEVVIPAATAAPATLPLGNVAVHPASSLDPKEQA